MTRLAPAAALALLELALSGPAAWADPPAAPPPADATRGITRLGPPQSAAASYPKKWALVIGIDQYQPPTKGLKNAVNDATKVKAKLEKYGFTGEQVIFLTDAKATRAEVMHAWEHTICNPAKVKAEDCVLVFFSGHGEESGKDTFLLPHDTARVDGKLTESSAVNLADIRKGLVEKCPAKHKLLILDSCHGGGVFRLDGDQVDPRRTPTEGSFEATRVTQAITSARGTQEAQDGAGLKNSPFTTSLLDALEAIPTKLNNQPGQYQFTTTVLFETLQSRLKEDPDLNKAARNQNAQCMWLDRERQGEFHFFPDPGVVFERRVADEEVLLLAMTPTTYGNWWADEVPWFMPGLRFEILESRPANRSGILGQLDRDRLRAAAVIAARRLKADNKSPAVQRRVRHLEMMFGEAGEGGSKDQIVRRIIHELKTEVSSATGPEGDTADPLDLHYLAVLEQKQGMTEDAATHYARALLRYNALIATQPRQYRPLYALCLADLATFELMVLKHYQAAAGRFGEARREYAADSPAPFKVYTLCKEAEAYRRLGYAAPAEGKLRKAEEVMTNVDPGWKSPLAAATLKQFAWADMEQWRFDTARDKFDAARAALQDHLSKAGGDEYRVDQLHIDHGLAMIARFQGDAPRALRLYRELTPEIVRTIEKLDQERNVFNYAEVRQLLYARLVNSLQRQADCSLFAPTPDYAEAADDYRRAVLETDNLNGDTRDEQRASLLYCQVIALAGESPAKDLDRARDLFARAEEARALVRKLPLNAEISRSIAFTLLFEHGRAAPEAVAPRAPVGPMAPVADAPVPLLERCIALRRENRALDRDELERLMFGYRLLIEARLGRTPAGAAAAAPTADIQGDRHELLRLVDDMLRACRLACRSDSPNRSGATDATQDRGNSDPDLLVYLRPYYELAFWAKLSAARPGADNSHPLVKELIEIAWEATQGMAYQKPAKSNPVLVLFCLRGQGCFLLDAPGFGSRCYVLSGLNPAQLVETRADPATAVARATTDRSPPLPLELLRDLRLLNAAPGATSPDRQLILRWGDPCHLLGYVRKSNVPGESRSAKVSYLYELASTRPFPFELRWAVDPDRCRRCPLERSFEAHVTYRPPTALIQPTSVSIPLLTPAPPPTPKP